jgi:uncharacterized delta-60 repeat protein
MFFKVKNIGIKLILISLVISTCSYLKAQNIDPNFRPVIKGIPDVTAISVLPDGKIILGGSISSVGSSPTASVLKLNVDGSLDITFQTSIHLSYPGKIGTISFDSDNKILVGAAQYNLKVNDQIIRLNPDGSFDNTFSCALLNIAKIECLPDGKYLVTSNNNLYRINNDGSIDEDFTCYSEPFGLYTGPVKALENGKILGAIHYTSISTGNSTGKLVRLYPNGSLDTSFDAGTCDSTGYGSYISDIALQSDGKILIGGYFSHYQDQQAPGIVRLDTNGAIDQSFAMDLLSILDRNGVTDLEIAKDNKIIVSGGCLGVPFTYKALRLNSDGNIDNSFETASFILPDAAQLPYNSQYHPSVGYSNGNTFVVGDHLECMGTKCLGVAALDSNGSMLSSFMPKIGGNPVVNAVYKQSDGKIIIGGEFSQVDSFYVHNIARFNNDGSFDETFSTNIGSGPNSIIKSIAGQNNSDILIGGDFTQVNDTYTGMLARLLPSGSLDASFSADVGQQYLGLGVIRILVDASDNILIGGIFENVNGQTRNNFAALNPDGTIDVSMASDPILPGHIFWVFDMAYQSDEKIIVGGRVINETGYYGFVSRINQDGTIDTDFPNSVSDIDVQALAVMDDDKIVVGNLACGYPASVIRQLNSNGEVIDSASLLLSPQLERCPEISSIQNAGGDQFIIGGSFSSVNGVEKPGLTKVSLEGDVDEYFRYDVEGKVAQFFQDDSTHLFVVGTFNHIGNDYTLFSIARIDINFPDKPTDLNGEISLTKSTDSGIHLTWTDHSYNESGFSLERSTDSKQFEKIAELANNTDNYTDQNVETDEIYYYRIKAYNTNGGSSYSNVAEIAHSSTSEIETSEVSVFPNPATDIIHIKTSSPVEYIEIYDALGNRTNLGPVHYSENSIQLEIKNLSKGIYFLRVQTENNVFTQKLIINPD